MAWRDQLRPASFRGVRFYIGGGADTEVGRRTVLHEYPQSDKPYTEDQGRRARMFSFDGFVVGPDYLDQKNALLAALEAAGPGQLIHPYFGEWRVAVYQPARVSESPREGGMARFQLSFVEHADRQEPSAKADTAARVDTAAGAARDALAYDFGKTFSVRGQGFIGAAALASLNAISDKLSSLAKLSLPLAGLSDALAAVSKFRAGLTDLLSLPDQLASELQGMFDSFDLLPSRGGLDGMVSMALTQSPTATLSSSATPSRQQVALNEIALSRLTAGTALASASRQASQLDYVSFDDARGVLDQLAGAWDEQLMDASPFTYPDLADLRAEVVNDLSERAANLRRVVQAQTSITLPALVVAHRLYRDATRADEVVARNRGRIRHPGFVPGGSALEVLSA